MVYLVAFRDTVPLGNAIAFSEGDTDARSKLQYFHQVSCPALVNYGSQRFWNQLVAQASHTEKSVHYLVLALTYLDYHDRTKRSAPRDDVFFLQHYTKGLALLQCPDVSVEVLLIAALLLILCDEMRNNPFAAVQHILAGRKILNAYEQGTLEGYSSTIQEIIPIFSSLAPYPGQCRPKPKTHLVVHNLPPRHCVLDHTGQRHAQSTGLGSIGAALRTLRDLIPQCLQARPRCSPPSTRFHVVPNVTLELNRWATDWDDLLQRIGTEVSSHRGIIKYMDVLHRCLTVMSRCIPFEDESLFDKYIPNFEYILLVSDQVVSPSDVDLVLFFFFVATRCRDPALRQRAISALRNCGWEGRRLALIAQRLAKVEEHGLGKVISCGDIPVESRVVILDASISNDLTFMLTLSRGLQQGKARTRFHYALVGSDFNGDAAVAHAVVQVSTNS